jgi:GTP-binding protein
VNDELRQYSPVLMKKPMVIVVNKMDLTGAEKLLKALQAKVKKVKVFPISAATGKGVNALLTYAARQLAKPEVLEKEPESPEPLRFVVELDFQIRRENGNFIIKGAKVEKLAAMTHFDQQEGLRRFQNILKKMGVEKELQRQGVQPGDNVRIGSVEFSYEP